MSNRKRKISDSSNTDIQSSEVCVEKGNNQSESDRKRKMTLVLQRVIDQEIKKREKEIENIEDRLSEAFRLQHLLRYAVVSSYYGSGTSQSDWPGNFSSKKSLHPAVAGLVNKDRSSKESTECYPEETCVPDSCIRKSDDGSPQVTKVPRYIPPVSKKDSKLTTSPTRGLHSKMKQRIIVGNVSRWIPPENREDGATHKWMIYVRGPANIADLSHLVDKVRFFLHASYRPFDVVEVKSSPFRLSRRGWGEFPIRVQVHFKNSLDKPIDIIHQLKLDRTRSVKDVLGSETIVEVWLHTDKNTTENLNVETHMQNESDEDNPIENVAIKQEVESESSDQEDMSTSTTICHIDQANIKTEGCNPLNAEDKNISELIPRIAQSTNTVNQETNSVSEEVVEDGCFLMEFENVIDMPNKNAAPSQKSVRIGNHRVVEVSSNSILKSQENGRSSILKLNTKPPLKYLVSGVSNTQHGVKLGTPIAKQSLIKGTSLLIKTANKPTGISLLLPNTKSSNAISLINSKKVPYDPKLSLYTSAMSNLSKRLHNDPSSAVRHLLNSLPIITSKASDPAYKTVHPYCAETLSIFISWPLPKQRASEWMRSRMVRKLLLNQGFSEAVENTWSTKNILQCGRLWGYSPIEPRVSSLSYLNCDEAETTSQISFPGCSYSVKKELHGWLKSSQKLTSKDEDDEQEIDVIGSGPHPKRLTCGTKKMGLGAHAAVKPKVIVMGLDPSLGLLSRFVDEKSRELGVVVSGIEEVGASIFYPAAQRTLIEALRSFVNYITRTSFCIANIRSNGSDTPVTIQPEDVKLALLEREEFDIFTNEGLGTDPEDSSKEILESAT